MPLSCAASLRCRLWADDERARLAEAVKMYAGAQWAKVAAHVGEYSTAGVPIISLKDTHAVHGLITESTTVCMAKGNGRSQFACRHRWVYIEQHEVRRAARTANDSEVHGGVS
jgi:hypothetical protein